MADRIACMRERLARALNPVELDIVDESAQHVGHVGAAGGGGHFRVLIRAACFNGRPLIERHRMVYQALAGLLHKEIHAVAIDARSTEE